MRSQGECIMAEPSFTGRSKWLWIVLVLVLLVVLAIWIARSQKERDLVVTVPAGQETEWAVEPTGPAVPVTLPTTPMTNAPATEEPE
jgi:cytochrome c-type biogenesis protein CcmH/NrfF